MPRSSLADLMDRISLGRASLGGGGGSFHRRGSLYSDISSGSSATRHWVNSVSDIYGPDEIEELLDELNRLEMAGLESTNDPEEEYDVDGSHCGVGGHPSGSRHHQHHHHRRKPHNRSSSPAFSVRSWDSHAFQASHPQRLPAVTVPLDADGSDDDGGGAGVEHIAGDFGALRIGQDRTGVLAQGKLDELTPVHAAARKGGEEEAGFDVARIYREAGDFRVRTAARRASARVAWIGPVSTRPLRRVLRFMGGSWAIHGQFTGVANP